MKFYTSYDNYKDDQTCDHYWTTDTDRVKKQQLVNQALMNSSCWSKKPLPNQFMKANYRVEGYTIRHLPSSSRPNFSNFFWTSSSFIFCSSKHFFSLAFSRTKCVVVFFWSSSSFFSNQVIEVLACS